MVVKIALGLLLGCSFLTACNKDDSVDEVENTIDSTSLPGGKTAWWTPVVGISFDWVLDDISSNQEFRGEVVDVDAFTTSTETVAALHAKGKKVIAYLSVGTLEDYRPDGQLLPAEVIGARYDEWPEERWVDIRQIDKLKPWLNSRFHMILNKGFDGIEPDNLDGYENNTGFNLNEDDCRKYMDYLIETAHANGLSIGQKNVNDLTNDYVEKFDWALIEDAFCQGWQNDMAPYIKLNKPIFAVEYTDEIPQSKFDADICPLATKLKFTTILKKRELDSWVHKCN